MSTAAQHNTRSDIERFRYNRSIQDVTDARSGCAPPLDACAQARPIAYGGMMRSAPPPEPRRRHLTHATQRSGRAPCWRSTSKLQTELRGSQEAALTGGGRSCRRSRRAVAGCRRGIRRARGAVRRRAPSRLAAPPPPGLVRSARAPPLFRAARAVGAAPATARTGGAAPRSPQRAAGSS